MLVDFAPISMVKTYAADRLERDEFSSYIDMIRHSARLLGERHRPYRHRADERAATAKIAMAGHDETPV